MGLSRAGSNPAADVFSLSTKINLFIKLKNKNEFLDKK
jgi:hypothetical protein